LAQKGGDGSYRTCQTRAYLLFETPFVKGDKMMHRFSRGEKQAAVIGGLVLALALMIGVTSVLAITWGEADEDNRYPNVGAFLVQRASDGAVVPLCSGTLIHEQVFLTAAHCTVYAQELLEEERITDVFVSFDFDVTLDETILFHVPDEGVITHPDYADFADPSNPHDVGALVLDEPVYGIEPAELPTEGFLDGLKRDRVLRSGGPEGAKFTVVGYGGVLDWYQTPPVITYEDQRRFAESEYVALVPAQLHLGQNMLHDNEGTCYGDSGGPTFWEPDTTTRILVALTSWGDSQCVVTGFQYRVDLAESLSFVGDVIDNYIP